jgi:hypothetical protein
MPDGPPSLRRALLIVLAGAAGTFVLWTLISGDLGTGATFGAIVLVVGAGMAAYEHRGRG